MSDRPDFRDLLGDDLTPEEELELARVDSLLRSVPGPPPEVPTSLTRRVERIGTTPRLWTRRRVVLAVALAAALAALFFGIGRRTGDNFDARATVEMSAAKAAPRASGEIQLGSADAAGNWKLRLVVDGLPKLTGDEYYVLWLAKDGRYAGTCGTFKADGQTTVEMTASYKLSDYDSWVISEARDNAPWLLSAKT